MHGNKLGNRGHFRSGAKHKIGFSRMTQRIYYSVILIVETRHCNCGETFTCPGNRMIRVEDTKIRTVIYRPYWKYKRVASRLPHSLKLIDTTLAFCGTCFSETSPAQSEFPFIRRPLPWDLPEEKIVSPVEPPSNDIHLSDILV